MNGNIKTLSAMLVLGITATIYAAPSSAQTLRSFQQGSAGNCHASKVFTYSGNNDEFGMSRSESGYLNTNSNNASNSHKVTIVCNPLGDALAVNAPSNAPKNTVAEVQLFARNTRTNRNVDLSCILYGGYIGSPSTVQITKSITLPKEGQQVTLTWSDAPNYATFYPTPISIVCDVPAGAELNDSVVLYLTP